jgi:hypothetical protein
LRLWGYFEETMTFFYISDDFANDVRRCIRSWGRQDPIIITRATIEGQIKVYIGTVQTIDRDRVEPKADYGAS